MKIARSLLVVAFVAIVAMIIPNQACAQSDVQNVGVKIGYVSKNSSAMIGAFYQCPITSNLRFSPEFAYTFANKDLSRFNIDLNFHFPLALSSSDYCLYPIVGLDYASWRRHKIHHNDYGEVSKTYSRIGANVGAGFEIYTKRNIKLNVEWKYTVTSKYSTTVLSAGIGYIF